jgi:type I restriction enzyme M protein
MSIGFLGKGRNIMQQFKMTQKQLEDYLWGAANILRGMIDAADFKQYIFPLLFFKRVSDLWDEEYQTALKKAMAI